MTTKKKSFDKSTQLYRNAKDLEQSGDLSSAEKYYRQALEIENNPGYWGALAWVLLGQAQFKEALSAAKKMREIISHTNLREALATANCLVGYIHHTAGRKALAERYYQESFQAYATAEAYLFLGLLHLQTERDVQAKINFQKAWEIESDNLEAHYNMAMWYKDHDDRERTLKHLQTALDLSPAYVPALIQLAVMMWKLGHPGFNEARNILEEALKYDEQNLSAHIYLAFTYNLLGKTKDAEQRFRIAISKFPADVSLYCSFAYFLAKEYHEEVEAEEFFRKAVEFDPKNGAAHFYYGQFLLENNRVEEGNDLLRKASQLGYSRAKMSQIWNPQNKQVKLND